ncbi:SRPBCC family protein [Cellulomonas fimi]|uniref:SRPBCC family protein n=1 Tax=Cellulomonas fimi TaxID=1708 RepID=UPI002359F70B|nr:SRPBCC domain-containing protein [Cellulomonas fimi]
MTGTEEREGFEMVDIIHRVGMRSAALDDVYAALTTIDGLSAWWTTDTTGDPGVGGLLAFRFPQGGFDMVVLEQEPGRRVVWEVVDGPEEWIGTTVRWELRQDGEWVVVLFAHEGWREPVEFMSHCSTKWATFLVSLKQLVETGAGAPAPDDLAISDWH